MQFVEISPISKMPRTGVRPAILKSEENLNAISSYVSSTSSEWEVSAFVTAQEHRSFLASVNAELFAAVWLFLFASPEVVVNRAEQRFDFPLRIYSEEMLKKYFINFYNRIGADALRRNPDSPVARQNDIQEATERLYVDIAAYTDKISAVEFPGPGEILDVGSIDG